MCIHHKSGRSEREKYLAESCLQNRSHLYFERSCDFTFLGVRKLPWEGPEFIPTPEDLGETPNQPVPNGPLCTHTHAGRPCWWYDLDLLATAAVDIMNQTERAAQVAQQLSICLRPRAWSWRPRIESHIGLPAWSLLLPLPVSLPLSLSVSWINK